MSDSEDRKALQRLLQAAERSSFDVVIMDLIDRTSRGGIFEFADICSRFLRFDVTPIWASDHDIDLTTQTGQLIAAAKAWGANQEKEAIVRRFNRGRLDRIAAGHLHRSTVPYGYQWADAERTMFEANPATAPIVQRIFHEIAAGGSATRLTQTLTESGVPTPGAVKGRSREHPVFGGREPRWTVPTIAAILANPAYKGQRAHNRFVSVKWSYKDKRERNLTSRAEIRKRDEDQWTIIPVPPLVTPDIWTQANATYHANARFTTPIPRRYTEEEVLLYGGYVRCAHCGYAMSPNRRNLDLGHRVYSRVWYYGCGHREPTLDGTICKGAAITCAQLGSLVWREAARLIKDPAYLQQLLQRGDEVWSPETQIAHYTQLLSQIDDEDRKITREVLRLSGKPGQERIRANLEQDAARHAEIREGYTAKLEQARDELTRRKTQENRVRTFAEWAADQAGTVNGLSAADRREVLIHSLHPTIFVARVASDNPRVALIFSVSPDAAARLDPFELYSCSQWQGNHGDYYATYVDQLGEPIGAKGGDTLDLSEMASQEVD